MYSRVPYTPRGSGNDIRREPSYRRGSGLPPNYSGTAFRVHPVTGDVTGADTITGALPRRPEDDNVPRFDDLPRVSRVSSAADPPFASPEAPPEGSFSETAASGGAGEIIAGADGSAGISDDRRAPPGHGIGYEEMLLLGLIFFLAKESDGEGDLKETLLLLGLLLLGG